MTPSAGPDSLHQQAVQALQAGDTAGALLHCQQLTTRWPDYAPGHALQGVLAGQQGQGVAALAAFDRAVALAPADAQTWSNRALLLRQLGRGAESLASYEQAARLAPQDVGLLQRCVSQAQSMADGPKTRQYLNQWLALTPEARLPRLQRAVLDLQSGALGQALTVLTPLLSGSDADAHYFAGIAQGQLGAHPQAIEHFRVALRAQPDHRDALSNLGGALWMTGAYEEAASVLDRCLALAPETPLLPGYRFNARRRLFQWEGDGETARQLEQAMLAGQAVDTPFPFLAVSDDPAAQFQCARLASRVWDGIPPIPRAEPPVGAKLRIGYLSTDFRTHPVSFLMAGVWEQHDRSRFEIHALSLNPPDTSPLGQRVRTAFDHFHDLGHQGDEAIARAIADLGLHVLIDLMGHTQGARPGILARRPAAVQISYLGFPGTSGMATVDYLIADATLIPEVARPHYSEKILSLPECFQANDDQRARPAPPPRSSLGLPEQGLVFCCFNNGYKLTPPFFQIWCDFLRATPGSVLWLFVPEAAGQARLRQAAVAQQIDPERLVFADRVSYEDHLARLGAADLFLDTLPFNGGTTVSDALWAGVPVLTSPGRSFAARMAASLLNALGLAQWVAPDLNAYRALGLTLARHPPLLAGLRHQLAMAREASAVFHTRRFTRHLEAGLEAVWDRYARGLAPDHVQVAPLDDPEAARLAHAAGEQALAGRQPVAAEIAFRRALLEQPAHLAAGNDLGVLLIQQQRFAEAADVFRATLQHWPDQISVLSNLATCLGPLGETEAMIDTYGRCLALAPDQPYLRGLRFANCLAVARWEDYAAEQATLVASALTGAHADLPLSFLSVTDQAPAQLACAQAYSRWLKLPPPPACPTPPFDGRLRVAYLSADFKAHAVSYLMAGVWEHHDRRQFEIVALSLAPPDGSPVGQRVRAAFDQFHEIGHLSDAAIVQHARTLGIHVLVDLLGHTRGARPGVLALRAAPIQINYLGFPGTSGLAAMDYLIADPYLIPPRQRGHYSEKVLCLPECFQANDDRRQRPPAPPRHTLGLPEDAVILASFNQVNKITPMVFDLWLDILHQAPRAILWLYAPESVAQNRLVAWAAQKGIAAHRLCFAGHSDYTGHLARLAAADLVLDTFPFNGGTCSSDALWAGVPVLTCSGQVLASRMAGSLLMALGLSELVTTDFPTYRQKAIHLATHPDALQALRSRLADARNTAPVFNTPRFTRHLEAAYQAVWQRHQAGLPPEHLMVSPLPA